MKVVEEPDRSKTKNLGFLGNTSHCFVGFNWVRDAHQVHTPALGDEQTKFECHACHPFLWKKELPVLLLVCVTEEDGVKICFLSTGVMV